MNDALMRYRYAWPRDPLTEGAGWTASDDGLFLERRLPENPSALLEDSRWPAFFPSTICFCTTRDVEAVALEKVTGATVANRFPYIIALSFCREALSPRHHRRSKFTAMLEAGGCAAIQFLPPGSVMDRALRTIEEVPEAATACRIAGSGLRSRPARTNGSPVFEQAYLVYEGTLAQPRRDASGRDVLTEPWINVGSHRIYFMEVRAIQLRQDIAVGRSKILWRSLPTWSVASSIETARPSFSAPNDVHGFKKTYEPNYEFPSNRTVSFELDEVRDGMAIKYIHPSPETSKSDNDGTRWPCIFPSSLGMITSRGAGGVPNVMPCGSTTVVSRHPMVIAPCISYAAINDRYAPRGTLETILRTGRFGCGVPFIDDGVVAAIEYAGSKSVLQDPNKFANAGLSAREIAGDGAGPPALASFPIHYDCHVIGEVPMGTHVMLLGEVRRILVRQDVSPKTPLEWCPWMRLAVPPPIAVRRSSLSNPESSPFAKQATAGATLHKRRPILITGSIRVLNCKKSDLREEPIIVFSGGPKVDGA
jgi:flavin reductase (DIM6/NTAB) family NADH-FMN oxidoreductase RutF